MVKNVRNSWLDIVLENHSKQFAEKQFHKMVKENPNDYFELVELRHSEECLKHTLKKEPAKTEAWPKQNGTPAINGGEPIDDDYDS